MHLHFWKEVRIIHHVLHEEFEPKKMKKKPGLAAKKRHLIILYDVDGNAVLGRGKRENQRRW